MVGLTNGWRVIPDQIDEARKLESSDILIFRNSDQSERRSHIMTHLQFKKCSMEEDNFIIVK